MPYISIPIDPSLNIAEVNEVLETDPVIASFVNGYFQRFLSNDQALKNMIDKKPSATELAKVATSGSYNDLSDKPNSIGSAEKLTNSRKFQTDLSSTNPALFDGSADNTHGVTGILGTANGGTGNSNGTMNADKINFSDRKTAQEKLGDIDGITDDLNCENPRIAASAVGLKKVSDRVGFDTKLIDGVPKWSPRGADTWSPFRSSGTVYFKKGTSANFADVIKSLGKNTTEFSSSNFRAIVTAIGAYSLKTNPNGGVTRSLTASVTARNININYTNTTGVVSASCPNPTLTVPSDSVATAEGGNPAPTIFGFVFDPSATPFAG